MRLYSLALFAHLVGAVCIFAGIGVWVFAIWALRRVERVELARQLADLIQASSKLIVAGILLLGAAGLYMAITVWGSQAAWIIVATVNFALLAPLGLLLIDPRVRAITLASRNLPDGPLPDALRARTRDSLLVCALNVYITSLLGIVYIMTNKPATGEAILAAVTAAVVGALASLPLWRPRTKQTAAPTRPHGVA